MADASQQDVAAFLRSVEQLARELRMNVTVVLDQVWTKQGETSLEACRDREQRLYAAITGLTIPAGGETLYGYLLDIAKLHREMLDAFEAGNTRLALWCMRAQANELRALSTKLVLFKRDRGL